MIKIAGLGPGDKNALTIGTLEALKSSAAVYLRTSNHPLTTFIQELGIEFQSYDEQYDRFETYGELYNYIAEDLIKKHSEAGDITYCVPGHPMIGETSVDILLKLCKEREIPVEVIPGASFIDSILEVLGMQCDFQNLKIIDASNIKGQVLDRRADTIITEVNNRLTASEVKLYLTEYYKDDTEIYYVKNAGIKDLQVIRKIPLYKLDREEDMNHMTSLIVPRNSEVKDFYDLTEIMDTLRGENGCPWDIEQSHDSLKRYLIEECYEVLEAIDEKDEAGLTEELGDVLLQVIFHARIAKEEGYFNINDIIVGICNKMIERHPHIFGEISVNSSEEVLRNWDDIKKREKGFETHTEILRHVAKNLPALIRAEKVQNKAAKVGFDWASVEPAMDKVVEELNEVKDVYKGKNRARILEEMGDLIFSTVNVARFLDIDPEFALNYTIDKFINRFEYIEKTAKGMGLELEKMSLEQMDILWNKSKK